MKNNMYQWAKELFPINRSITGDGVRKTLRYIKNEIVCFLKIVNKSFSNSQSTKINKKQIQTLELFISFQKDHSFALQKIAFLKSELVFNNSKFQNSLNSKINDIKKREINLPELKGEELLKKRGIKSHFLMEF